MIRRNSCSVIFRPFLCRIGFNFGVACRIIYICSFSKGRIVNFVDFLYRIKQELDLKQDKDVANFLGLEIKAFSARKARNSVPEDKLRLAAIAHPDMKIDVDYILTGTRSGQTEIVRAPSPSYTDKRLPEKSTPSLSEEEQELLALFRQSSELGRAVIMSAARGAEKKEAASAADQVA